MDLEDIAKKAKVSVMTVSRAVNPATRDKVAQETLKKIDRFIAQYNYTPSKAARNLRLKVHHCIGLAFPYLPGIFYSHYYAQVLAGVSDCLHQHDYNFKLLMLDESRKWGNYNFRSGESIDAMVIAHWFKLFSGQDNLSRVDIPCVIVNDYDSGAKNVFTAVDQTAGGKMAAEHLYGLGHRHIAVITGPQWSLDSRQRMEGFLDYLNTQGCPVPETLVEHGDFFEADGHAATERLLARDAKITAIFAVNDQAAYGVLKRLKERQIDCPRDISVVGFDDDPPSAYIYPALTTVKAPVYDAAFRAAELLIEYLTSGSKKAFTRDPVLFTPSLIARASSVRLP